MVEQTDALIKQLKEITMATITEDYVSFEIAKLLKEKGFPQDPNICNTAYTTKGKFSNNAKSFAHNYELIKPRVYSIAPTLQIAMKWLREMHKIHIIAEPCLGEGFDNTLCFNRWFWTILKEEGEYKPIRRIDEFPTYEDACEAAIKYCLENLI